jgi:hypothetical protein
VKPRTALALVFAVSIAWVAFALVITWPTPVCGQTAASAPASAASAADPVTYDSPCGAPAVGRSIRDDRLIRGQFDGQHVNAKGHWEICIPEVPPKDCPDMASPRWFASGAWCDPLQPTIHAGNLGQVRRVNQAGFKGGWRDYQCLQRADGVKRWVPLRSTCR